MRFINPFTLLVLPLAAGLGGCEIPGLADDARFAEAKEADGRAIGGACRHSGRALEDCYVMNPKAIKAAVYAGWRDMDTYMRENDIKPVVPDLLDPPTGGMVPAAPTVEEKKAGARRSAAPEAPEPPLPRRFT